MSIRYTPTVTPSATEELPKYLKKELDELSAVINNQADGHQDRVHVAPAKPRDGDIRYADGTNWDPGKGKGYYHYDSDTSGWVKHSLDEARGMFYDTTDQTPASANTAQAITWNSTGLTEDISIGTPTSRIVFDKAGCYEIAFSAQVTSGSSSSKDLWFWPKVNGVDVPNTTMKMTISDNSATQVFSRAAIFVVSANDYLEAYWAADSTSVTLEAAPATAFAPATPSVILTVNKIGDQ